MEYRRYRSGKQFKGDGDETTVRGRKVPHGYTLEVTYFAAGFISDAEDPWELGYEDSSGNQFPLARTKFNHLRETRITTTVWLEAGETPYAKCGEVKTIETAFFTVHGKLWPTKEKVIKDAEVQQEDNVSNDSKPQ